MVGFFFPNCMKHDHYINRCEHWLCEYTLSLLRKKEYVSGSTNNCSQRRCYFSTGRLWVQRQSRQN